MTQIIDGRQVAAQIFDGLKTDIERLKSATGRKPGLAVFLVGENPSSASYVKAKKQKAEEIGLSVEIKKYPPGVFQDELIQEIQNTNQEKDVSGIIVQLPLPAGLDKQMVIDAIHPALDVDCLTTANKTALTGGREAVFMPPAASAVLAILDYYHVDLQDKKVLIVGSGDLVGKPLAELLRRRRVNFEIADRKTANLQSLALEAEIIVTGVGKKNLITAEMVKEGAVVIDAGTTGAAGGEVSGDVDFEGVSKKSSLITPVPGGVGPVTIAMLFKNVLKASRRI